MQKIIGKLRAERGRCAATEPNPENTIVNHARGGITSRRRNEREGDKSRDMSYTEKKNTHGEKGLLRLTAKPPESQLSNRLEALQFFWVKSPSYRKCMSHAQHPSWAS